MVFALLQYKSMYCRVFVNKKFWILTSRVLNYQTSADFIDHCYYFCTLKDFNKKSQTLFPFLSDCPHYIPFIHFLLSSLSLFHGVFFFHSPHYLSFLVFLPLSPSYMCEYSSACIYVSTCVCGRGREQDFWLEEEVREIEISEREGKKQREKQSIYWNKTCCFNLIDKGRLLTTFYLKADYSSFLQSIIPKVLQTLLNEMMNYI